MGEGTGMILRNTEGEFLLQFRDGAEGIGYPLHWDLFGGGVEVGETILESAQRELWEELELKVSLDDLREVGKAVSREGILNYFVEYVRPVWMEDLRLREGAGWGFFTIEEIQRLQSVHEMVLVMARNLAVSR